MRAGEGTLAVASMPGNEMALTLKHEFVIDKKRNRILNEDKQQNRVEKLLNLNLSP